MNEPLFPGSRHTSFNTLVLDARLNMTWYHSFSTYQREHAQYVRDQFINDMQNILGDTSPHGFYAHVYLNGIYWGLYCVHERPDDAFMADYLGGEPEDYDVMKHDPIPSRLLSGSLTGYLDMMNLARSGMTDNTAYESLITQYLDLEPFTNYMLLNFWAGNTDWAHHNWYVGRNHTEEGSLFRYYSWDAEHVLKADNDNRTTRNDGGAPTELHHLLKLNPNYLIQFADKAHKLMKNGGLFTQTPARDVYNVRANEIYDAVIAESARWGDHRRDHRGDGSAVLYKRDDWWIPELDRILNSYFPNRADTVIGQLRNDGVYPATEAPVYNIGGAYQHGGVIASGAVLTIDNPNASGKIYYTLDGTDPRQPAEATPPITIIPEATTKSVLVPSSDIGTNWRTEINYLESGWTQGTGGVGYDTGSRYDPLIGIDVEAGMYNINGTCYVRIPFTVDAADLASLASITLNVRYDDGFIAYLNGGATPIAQANEPASPAWNSTASSGHSDGQAEVFQSFDVTANLGSLQAGNNFLAIHALNRLLGNGDFLFSVELTGSTSPPGSDVSPTAIDYSVTPPPPLTDTTRVLARVLDNSAWSAINDAVYQIDTSDYGTLRITEIMYNPADPAPGSYWNNDDFEFIEIKNTGSYTLDLTGVTLDNGVYFSFNDSSIHTPHLLAPGQYIVVVKNDLAFRSRYGDSIYVAGRYDGSLDNGGEAISLLDPAAAPILQFTYNDAWFPITDGEGFSMAVMDENEADLSVWNTRNGWRPSSAVGGTPGASDTFTVPGTGAIVINEVLAHSHAGDPDWIELHNTTAAPIDIGGWYLSDDNNDLKKYEIPLGTSIAADEYMVFYENTHFGPTNPLTPFALSENGEAVYLTSASGGEFTGYSESEDFGASETDVAFGRYFKSSTGTYNFVAMTANTPGFPNAAPKIGPIVISEIMYHPQDAPTGDPDAEYIELYNITALPVLLQDLTTGATWSITDGVDFTFPAGTTIPANGRLILALDLTAFNAEYPGVPAPVLQWTSGRLSNGGERVQIAKPGDVDGAGRRQYIRVDRVTYADLAPWPTTPDGFGDALHRQVLTDYGNDVANWQAGAPTPGS